jgi:hypothetical protein
MDTLSPLDQYQRAIEGKDKVWCFNIASIYTGLATAADIPTRLVGLGGEVNGIKVSGHAAAESYLSSEQSWGLVDLTSYFFLPRNPQGTLLNSADVIAAVVNKGFLADGFRTTSLQGNKMTERPLRNFSEALYRYYEPRTTIFFPPLPQTGKKWLQNFLRYSFKPDRAYSKNPNNFFILFKESRTSLCTILRCSSDLLYA